MSEIVPVILAIDCSDRACSIALGDSESVFEEYTDEPRQHAKKLLPMYRQLLTSSPYQQSDITAIAIAAGPGSFTGLRIGFSFAQGLAFALSVPLIQVSSLEAMAVSNLHLAEDQDLEQVHICLDARMGELYVAAFDIDRSIGSENKLNRRFDDALIGLNDFDVSSDYSSAVLVGSGFALHELSSLTSSLTVADACIHATAVHKIGLRLHAEGKLNDAIGAEPVYLRRENAWKTVSEQKQASLEKERLSQ